MDDESIEILSCPKCKALHKKREIVSEKLPGDFFWTDFKSPVLRLNQPSEVTRCCSCSKLFWVLAAKHVARVWGVAGDHYKSGESRNEVMAKYSNVPYILDLGAKGYLDALSAGFGKDLNNERYLRLLYWWTVNDAWRDKSLDPDTDNSDNAANLQKFLKILDKRKSMNAVTAAEIYREQGLFDKSIKILKRYFISEDHLDVADAIRQLAREGSRRIIRVKMTFKS